MSTETLRRRQRIEALLADWFRREGWSVEDGVAYWRDADEWTGKLTETELSLERLAGALVDEIERDLA